MRFSAIRKNGSNTTNMGPAGSRPEDRLRVGSSQAEAPVADHGRAAVWNSNSAEPDSATFLSRCLAGRDKGEDGDSAALKNLPSAEKT